MQPIRQPWTRTAALSATLIVAAFWILFCLAWLVFVDWYDLAWYLDLPAMIMLPLCLGLLVGHVRYR